VGRISRRGEAISKLEEACGILVRAYPPAREVLSSCTLVGLPFSLSLEGGQDIYLYFYQVALWLERGGRLYRAGEPSEGLRCFYAPLILVRDECVLREEPIMIAIGLLHEVEHLRRYPIYTRKVLELVGEGMGRDEAIPLVREEEERIVEERVRRLCLSSKRLWEAYLDASLVEDAIASEDRLRGNVIPWNSFRFLLNFYVFYHRGEFRVYECFRDLAVLLTLDARRKSEALARAPPDLRRELEQEFEAFSSAGRDLKVSWVFRWGEGA